jgi:hypothetical protein
MSASVTIVDEAAVGTSPSTRKFFPLNLGGAVQGDAYVVADITGYVQ